MILIPVGTKAQLIKMAPVMLSLDAQKLDYDFVLTGQHKETMDDLIKVFGLKAPAYELAPVDEASTHAKLAQWLVQILRNGLPRTSPIAEKRYQLCLVHGDTLSTLVTAIIAKRHGIKVAHIEAGLRSFNLLHPFPEELVRRLVSHISDIFYCPGQWAADNLSKYAAKGKIIVNTGENTLLDSVRLAISQGQKQQSLVEDYAIASIHRNENLSNEHRFNFIMNQIVKISGRCKVKFVLHPATRERIQTSTWNERLTQQPSIELIPRMDYVRFTQLLRGARFIVTDGGSNQEECYYLNLPCLVMRKATERNEGIGLNAVLANYDEGVIETFVKDALSNKAVSRSHSLESKASPSDMIAEHLASLLHNA